ncbi:hypothetical protein QP324_04240, partial [Corynebacterium sp. UMB0012]|nr:hypothetical protein [Corynebacterium sp. UMB0012]
MSITETTTQRGYGYKQHQKTRKNLLFNLVDGTECEYCARPMFRDPAKNFDGAALEADHVDRDKTQPEVPRVLFLGICLDFYYFLWRFLLPK